MAYSDRDPPLRDVVYDPLPAVTSDRPTPSPEPPSLSYSTPQYPARDLPPLPPVDPQYADYRINPGDPRNPSSPLLGQHDPQSTPAHAPQARFFGPALYDEADPQSRYSLVSNHTAPSVAAQSDYNSSVYALNDARGSFDERELYRDEPIERPYYSAHLSDSSRPPLDRSRYLDEKRSAYTSPRTVSKRRIIWCSILAASIVVIAAVVIPLYFAVIKPRNRSSSSPAASHHSSSVHQPTPTARPPATNVAITGGDGSTVTLEDSSTFVYQNTFGGYWYHDPNNPHHGAARAQSWSPALNETFRYGIDRIRGSVLVIIANASQTLNFSATALTSAAGW